MKPGRHYLDYAASAPMLPECAGAMRPWLEAGIRGNASSQHLEGRTARNAIDEAREAVSSAFGCEFGEVVFTSSGTESVQTALIGLCGLRRTGRTRVLVSAAAHPCALELGPALAELGCSLEELPTDRYARIRAEDLELALDEHVLCVSLMHANNELGTIEDLSSLTSIARRFGARVHVDAVQPFCHEGLEWDVKSLDADLVSVSAHKIGGPQGIGALYVRAGTPIRPLMPGSQEREMRGGTENVAAIVGFGAAVRADRSRSTRWAARDAFISQLAGGPFVKTVPTEIPTLDGHAHYRLPGHSAESVLIRLDQAGIAASSGAACSSGSVEPSHVLLACDYDQTEAAEGLRFTFGPDSLPEEAAAAGKLCLEVGNGLVGACSRT